MCVCGGGFTLIWCQYFAALLLLALLALCPAQPLSPCGSTRREFAGKWSLSARRYEIYVPPNGRGCLPPLLAEFLMPGFYEVGRGASSCCLHRTPISALIHYLCCRGTHMPRNTRSPILNFLLPHRSPFRVADEPECCQSTRPRCQCCS